MICDDAINGRGGATCLSLGKWPDFIGLGVAKCGTTWLFDMLSQHPEISFARADRENAFCYATPEMEKLKEENLFPIKEVQFWNHLYSPFNEKRKFLSAYKKLFRDAQSDQVSGEITNNYLLFLLDRNILKAFHASMPGVKLFVVLRNPIERFISHHFYQYDIMELHRKKGWRNTYYARGNFHSLQNDIEQVSSWLQMSGPKDPFNPPAVRLFLMGLYAMSIRNLLTRYDESQTHIILFDDIKENPDLVLKRLCNFLGITPDFQFKKTYEASNKTETPKEAGKIERKVLAELYAPSISEISGILARNLSHWLD
jgi:hypothetical protein